MSEMKWLIVRIPAQEFKFDYEPDEWTDAYLTNRLSDLIDADVSDILVEKKFFEQGDNGEHELYPYG